MFFVGDVAQELNGSGAPSSPDCRACRRNCEEELDVPCLARIAVWLNQEVGPLVGEAADKEDDGCKDGCHNVSNSPGST